MTPARPRCCVTLISTLALLVFVYAPQDSEAGQVNVVNPGGVTGVLPPSPPVTPPPSAPGQQGTSTAAGGETTGETKIPGAATLSPRRAAILAQMQSLPLSDLTASELTTVLVTLQGLLGDLGEDNPLHQVLREEVARVNAALAKL